MDQDRFIKMVKLMRKSQKLYFRTRHQSHLTMAKVYEKEVDEMIAHQEAEKHGTQEQLFK